MENVIAKNVYSEEKLDGIFYSLLSKFSEIVNSSEIKRLPSWFDGTTFKSTIPSGNIIAIVEFLTIRYNCFFGNPRALENKMFFKSSLLEVSFVKAGNSFFMELEFAEVIQGKDIITAAAIICFSSFKEKMISIKEEFGDSVAFGKIVRVLAA